VSTPENLKLLDLHDQKIWNLRLTLEKAKLRANEIKENSDQLEKLFEEQVTNRKSFELKVREVESKTAQTEQEKEKLEKRVLQATSVKMLDASKAKILELESSMVKLEEEWMEASELLEEAVSRESTLREKLEKSKLESEGEWDSLNAQLMSTQKELPELIEQRPGFLDGLETRLVELYETRRKSDPFGLKIFEIEDENCPGCSMQLTLRIYDRVRYSGEIEKCPNCGVIVYWGT